MKVITIVLTAVISFFLFLFLLFPFGLVNQALSSRVLKETGLLLDIEDISFSLPLGVKATKVLVSSSQNQQIRLNELSVGLEFLPLLIGNIKPYLDIQDNKKGKLRSEISLSIFSLLSGNIVLPQSIVLDSKKFSLDQFLNFALNMLSQSKGMNVMVQPLLKSMLIEGSLNTEISLDLDSSDLKKSKGFAKINLNSFMIKNQDNPPIFPAQLFKKANIKAELKEGTLTIDKSSELSSKDLSLKIYGNIMQRSQLMKSIVDLNIDFELRSVLNEQYGFLIEAFTKKTGSSQIRVKVEGPLSPQPSVKIL